MEETLRRNSNDLEDENTWRSAPADEHKYGHVCRLHDTLRDQKKSAIQQCLLPSGVQFFYETETIPVLLVVLTKPIHWATSGSTHPRLEQCLAAQDLAGRWNAYKIKLTRYEKDEKAN